MKAVFKLIVCFALTLAGLAIFTEYDQMVAVTKVAGMPVIAFGFEAPAWIAFAGYGVLVLGMGVGVVSLTIYGAGLLFATGQVAGGLIALGQAGLGLILFLGQGGLGLHMGGQVGFGLRRWNQITDRDESYFRAMWAELAETLTLSRRGEPRAVVSQKS